MALSKFLDSIDESTEGYIYVKLFAVSPAGHDHFKQSNTYLHLIVAKVMNVTLELFREPYQIVDYISAIGLKHVGHGVAIDSLGPFVSSCIEVITSNTKHPLTDGLKGIFFFARSIRCWNPPSSPPFQQTFHVFFFEMQFFIFMRTPPALG